MLKYIPIIISMASALLACSKDDTLHGVLSLDITNNTDVFVTEQTKAISESDLDNFIIDIPGSGILSGYYKDMKGEKFIVMADTYTATAYSCTEEVANGQADESDKYGCIRYAGDKKFTIESGSLTNITIPCTVSNSKISVQLKENFLKALKKEATTVTITTNNQRSERPLTFSNFTILQNNNPNNWATAMSAEQSDVQYAYYPAESTLYIDIATQKVGRPASEVLNFSIELPVTTQLATWHQITIDADLTNAPTGISVQVGEIIDVINNGISIDRYNSGNLTEDL